MEIKDGIYTTKNRENTLVIKSSARNGNEYLVYLGDSSNHEFKNKFLEVVKKLPHKDSNGNLYHIDKKHIPLLLNTMEMEFFF